VLWFLINSVQIFSQASIALLIYHLWEIVGKQMKINRFLKDSQKYHVWANAIFWYWDRPEIDPCLIEKPIDQQSKIHHVWGFNFERLSKSILNHFGSILEGGLGSIWVPFGTILGFLGPLGPPPGCFLGPLGAFLADFNIILFDFWQFLDPFQIKFEPCWIQNWSDFEDY